MRKSVNCPACGCRFEAISGSECYCGCGSLFRVYAQSGELRTELIPRKPQRTDIFVNLESTRLRAASSGVPGRGHFPGG